MATPAQAIPVKGQVIFEERLADPNSFRLKGGATVILEEGDDNCTCWEPDFSMPRIIQTDQGFNVKLKWCTVGCLVNAICGDWCIEILMEKKGKGEFELPDQYRIKEVPFVAQSGHCYDVTCEIPKFQVRPGVYDICVLVTLKDGKGRPLPVVIMSDLGGFTFYNDSAAGH